LRHAVALLVVLVAAMSCFSAVQSPSASPSGVVAPSPTANPAPSATASPTSGIVTYDNPILGYRISLPTTYRRLSPVLFTGEQEILGRDMYTLQTEQQEREECLHDLGDTPPPSIAALLFVETYRNVANVSATEWVGTPRVPGAQPLSMQRRVEPLTIGGREAVRLVADDATAEVHLFAVRGDDRIYVITPTMWVSPPQHQLASIAATFETTARQPLLTPTPTTPPAARQQAASEVTQALAKAFAARDADAVARLMPQCRLGVSLVEPLPNSSGGGVGRSVALFTQALRDRFSSGDLVVTLDTTVQLQTEGGRRYVARSDWREPDRTVRIDLVLDESEGGRWQWVAAIHHYQQADFVKPYCIPYRSPWVTHTSSC
jgi:hypothetical protein